MAAAGAEPCPDDSLVECALKVLQCPDPWKKADYTYATVKLWRDGVIKRVRPVHWEHLKAPDRPARSDDKVKVCTPGEAPRRGKGGTLASRQALLHSAVHIENWAVDLSWDVIARFGLRAPEYGLPRQFFDDFVTVAEDECRHFSALARRLEETGSHYGAFAVHDGLWESASNSAHSLPARLAVEHCVHEARGLDVLPSTIAKFANHGDSASAALFRDVIYPEEVNHCAAGVRWIRYLYDVAHGRLPPAEPADSDSGDRSSTNGPSPSKDPAPTDVAAGSATISSLAGLSSLVQALNLEAAAATAPGPGSVTQEGPAGETLAEGGAEPGPLASGHEREGGSAGNAAEPSTGEAAYGAAGAAGAGSGAAGGGSVGLPSWVLDARKYGSVEEWFHSLVRAHFWGALKPPFNAEARAKAGFGPEWYLPLAAPSPAKVQAQPATEAVA